jgi:segregation and condensation protein A
MEQQPRYHLEGVVKAKETMEDFDGPLDVILLLLSKNKIEIKDIQIAVILDQYLAYLDEMKRMDLEIASSFLTMASYLVYLKSKMLLSLEDREEALTEMELLIRSLEERRRQDAYDQLKKAAQVLESRNDLGRALFTKEPEPLPVDHTYHYQHDKQDLVRAYANMAERSEKKLPPPTTAFEGIVGVEPYPVTTKAAQILKKLLGGAASKLRQLFRGNKSRSELVATFLAVLELSKLRSIYLGTDAYGETTITYLKMPDEGLGEQEATHETGGTA